MNYPDLCRQMACSIFGSFFGRIRSVFERSLLLGLDVTFHSIVKVSFSYLQIKSATDMCMEVERLCEAPTEVLQLTHSSLARSTNLLALLGIQFKQKKWIFKNCSTHFTHFIFLHCCHCIFLCFGFLRAVSLICPTFHFKMWCAAFDVYVCVSSVKEYVTIGWAKLPSHIDPAKCDNIFNKKYFGLFIQNQNIKQKQQQYNESNKVALATPATKMK